MRHKLTELSDKCIFNGSQKERKTIAWMPLSWVNTVAFDALTQTIENLEMDFFLLFGYIFILQTLFQTPINFEVFNLFDL